MTLTLWSLQRRENSLCALEMNTKIRLRFCLGQKFVLSKRAMQTFFVAMGTKLDFVLDRGTKLKFCWSSRTKIHFKIFILLVFLRTHRATSKMGGGDVSQLYSTRCWGTRAREASSGNPENMVSECTKREDAYVPPSGALLPSVWTWVPHTYIVSLPRVRYYYRPIPPRFVSTLPPNG